MIPALCRWLRRLFDPRPAARVAPLDDDADARWRALKAQHPVTFLHDEREPHLASDRRVDESLGPRVLPGAGLTGPGNGRSTP